MRIAVAAVATVTLGACRSKPRADSVEAARSPPPQSVAAPGTTPPACELWDVLEESELEPSRSLTLGQRGRVELDEGTDLYTEMWDPCRITFGLAAGRVVVHAKDLGGGELVVVGRSGSVRARAAILAVAQRDGELAIEVAEGVVDVRRSGVKPVELHAGERIVVDGARVETTKLSDEERAAVLQELSEESAAVVPH